ncbi:hypothetical protein D3C81_1467470 [compost metagenome]
MVLQPGSFLQDLCLRSQHDAQKFFLRKRFDDKFVSAQMNRLLGILEVRIPADQDHFAVMVRFEQMPEHRQTIHLRHPNVGDHQVRFHSSHEFQPIATVGGSPSERNPIIRPRDRRQTLHDASNVINNA